MYRTKAKDLDGVEITGEFVDGIMPTAKPAVNKITPLETEFGREDLNILRDKLNQAINFINHE